MDLSMSENSLDAYFGAGCFWGVEQAFLETPGVMDTAVGYAGGDDVEFREPTYKQVCTGDTGHAEVVHVIYDPTEIDYEELVVKFFEIHNPTQFNRQGPDYGSQYRSAIFYVDEDQKKIAEEVKIGKASDYERKIVTQIVPFTKFWRAEEYHQKYFQKKGGGSCHINY